MKSTLDTIREAHSELANLDFALTPRCEWMDNSYCHIIYCVAMWTNSGCTAREFNTKESALAYAKKQMRRRNQVTTTHSYWWTCEAFYD